MRDFCESLANDPKLGTSLAGIRASCAILAAPVDGKLTLDDSAHEKSKAAMEEPTNGYIPQVARQLMPFFEAIRSAK